VTGSFRTNEVFGKVPIPVFSSTEVSRAQPTAINRLSPGKIDALREKRRETGCNSVYEANVAWYGNEQTRPNEECFDVALRVFRGPNWTCH
jgi:hypothetical protein